MSLLSPAGPFITAEPAVAGPADIVTVQVQPGVFSGLSFSGMGCTVGSYAPSDFALASPQSTVRSLVCDAAGGAVFQAVASSLATGQQNLVVRYGANPSQTGTQPFEVSLFGALAVQLDDLLCAFRHIPRFEEPGRISEDGKKATWGWGRWHLEPVPVLVKNSRTWLDPAGATTGYSTDYQNGSVFFNTPMVTGEEVHANYSMRLLDLAIYKRFFGIALNFINLKKPQSAWDASAFPAVFAGPILLYGYVQACRTIIPKLSTFAYRRLFENADQLVASLQANMASAQAEFDLMMQTVKRRGDIMPAAVATFNIGRQGVWQWDGININSLLVSR